MRIRRLSWAGIEILANGCRLLIDVMQTTEPLKGLLGEPHWAPLAIAPWDGKVQVDALVTHRHPDHLDAHTLQRSLSPSGRVYCPLGIVTELEARGLNARGVAVWETARPRASQDIAITAVPAVDWRGDDQVSWVVEDGQQRVFHGGDTIWHGSWWKIAERFSNFDAVFLPVNGVVARLAGMEPSNLPATLTPEQAAIAARLLKARIFCPMHFGQFDNPDTYRQYPDLDRALRAAATRENVKLCLVKDGETVPLGK